MTKSNKPSEYKKKTTKKAKPTKMNRKATGDGNSTKITTNVTKTTSNTAENDHGVVRKSTSTGSSTLSISTGL